VNKDLVSPKIAADLDEAAARLAAVREGGKVVFTNGCFDLLHAGHVHLLTLARSMGDILVIGVNDDESVRRLGKSPERPLTPLPERMYVLAALECVSLVAPFREDTPARIIEAVEPDVLIKGGDWPVDEIVGREFVEARGGKVLSLPLLPGYSTTRIIEIIKRKS
jgi:rfaE bifunctional protein nucleotidyltransferase chain/domain